MADFDLRGPDTETLLVGPITATIIDADRRVRMEWDNGFPNWAMYRTVYAGDAHLRGRLREWCVAYAVAYCAAGGVRKGLPGEEIGCLAGWDAYYALFEKRWLIAGQDVADVCGVDPKTYRKVRNHVTAALFASLREYWTLLQIHYMRTMRDERREPETARASTYSIGRGFENDGLDFSGTGNWITPKRGSGC